MKKKILLLMGVFSIGILLYAQVGINTQSPQGIFHVDSKGDTNGATNVIDDILVDANGNMGIGTITPQAKLHIVTGGTSSSPKSGIILKDGNEVNGRVLTTDATGLATWKQLGVAPAVQGYLNRATTLQLNYSYASGYLSTGCYIDLPPGKWIVNVVMLITNIGSGQARPVESVWVRSTFADQGLLTISPDIEGSPLISGLCWKNTYSLLQGFIIINNNTSAAKRYDYIMGGTENNGSTTGYLNRPGGGWNEDNIVAYLLM